MRAETRRKQGMAGGQAGQHKLSSLGQGPTMSPGSHGSGSYIAAGLLRTDTSSDHRAPAWFWTVGAKASLLDTCFRVFARCAKKKIFNSFTSFSRWKWFIFSLSISAFWSNGLASGVVIFSPILLRFLFIVFIYGRAKIFCYRFFNFNLRKTLCCVKADGVV